MRSGIRRTAVLAVIAAFGAGAGSASAATQTDSQALQDAVKVGTKTSGILKHENALQKIANANDGNRATGTSGHEASADYVKQQLEATGYFNVSTQPFIAPVFTELAPPSLSANPAQGNGWTAGTDYLNMEFSGTGTVTNAPVAVIGFVEPTNQASASAAGCDDSQFPAGATSLAGKVAVIQRGTCDFAVKASLAQDHGAAGVIIFNEGTLNDPDRQGLINGTLGNSDTYTIPVLDATYAVGRHLVDNASTATVSISTNNRTDMLPTRNVIAETKTGRTDRTVAVGAHLDSVSEGPGINDDGSGTATNLEVALQMAKLGIKPANQVRFLWFSGEEQGLIGSDYYVSRLTSKQASNISVMLDFDMLASGNYAELIYDGDGSEFGVAGPNGSGAIEDVFQRFFDERGEYTERIPFDGRSDYDAFTTAGIPAGGIFTGAEEHKTAFQRQFWGGTVATDLSGQFDPCYHLACDTYANLNTDVLSIMSDAVADSVVVFSKAGSSVNGADNGSVKPFEWKGNRRTK